MDKERRIILLKETQLDSPEDIAKMQALYSRSAESSLIHLEKVKETGSAKFMESFYVGYGHGSIGDCGTVTLFIENVSILAAKAIQDTPLYNGQETSTRYIDMANQPLVDPLGTPESREILDDWMDFYKSSQETVREHLKTVYPINEGEDEKVYEKAVKARAFDTLRAFLPAGISTQLSWHTSLRHAADRVALLKYYPLLEAADVSQEIHRQLKEAYPASFSHKEYPAQEAYREAITKRYSFYFNPDCPDFSYTTTIRPESLEGHEYALEQRPLKTNLPVFLNELGTFTCDFLLDYGSSRDLQRHRNGVYHTPLLTTKLGFQKWYLNELPEDLREKAKQLIAAQKQRIDALETTDETRQYYIPLGFLVSCRIVYTLPQMVYVTELRADKTVHPSLRPVAHKMHEAIKESFPSVALHTDLEESNWDVRRGKQDIVRKTS